VFITTSGGSHILYDWQYLASKKNMSGGIYISYGNCPVCKGRGEYKQSIYFDCGQWWSIIDYHCHCWWQQWGNDDSKKKKSDVL